MTNPPTESAAIHRALAALTTSRPPVVDAIAHLISDLPRARLLNLRLAPSVANAVEARRIVEPFGSAILMEQFCALPLELADAPLEALRVRLDAMMFAPRYDPWLCARILTGAGRCLAALGWWDEVRAVATRALAFLPWDPCALAILAEADLATGNSGAGHAILARLRDDGYAAPVVSDVAPEAERGIEAYIPHLDNLETMDDDELGDYLVYTRLDVASTDTALQPRRHAANLLRRGDVGGAWVALARTADWECHVTSGISWLGVSMGVVDSIANEALMSAIEATPAGARVVAANNKRGIISPFSLAIPTRQEALGALIAAGELAEAATLLADWTLSVRLLALGALPDHPTSLRVAGLASALDSALPNRSVMAQPNEATSFHGSSGTYRRGDAFIEYPTPRMGTRDPMTRPTRFPPRLRLSPTARGTCAVCKKKFEKGQLRLEVTPLGSRKRADTLVHPSCATTKKFAAELREALLRDRRGYQQREELEIALR